MSPLERWILGALIAFYFIVIATGIVIGFRYG